MQFIREVKEGHQNDGAKIQHGKDSSKVMKKNLRTISQELHITFFIFSSFSITIKFVEFCQSTSWQHAMHTVLKERGGDYRAMASCQSVLREG